MKTKIISARCYLANTTKALKRAARKALETAKKMHTPCYIIKDSLIVDIAKAKNRVLNHH